MFPPIFGLFAIFERNFSKTVAPPSDGNKNCLAVLKGQSLLKKNVKTEWKSTHKQRHNSCSKYIPLERTRPTRSVTNKQNQHHIFAPTAGARCTICPKLCMVIELVETIKKCGKHFLIQRIAFLQGARKNSTILTDARFISNNSVTCEANIE